MSADLERLVLEKHQLLAQRAQMAGILCAILRTRGGTITLPKTAFREGDAVNINSSKTGAVTLRLQTAAAPPAEKPEKQPVKKPRAK